MKDSKEEALAKACGRRIRQLRNRLGWSQPELAQYLDCNAETISKAERGLHMMKSWRLAKLCLRCGVSMDYMIFGISPDSGSSLPPHLLEVYRTADADEREILGDHLALAIKEIRRKQDLEDRLRAYRKFAYQFPSGSS